MMKRKDAWYAVIGGCVGTVLTMVVCLISPLGAQNQSNGNFGKITCSELEVVRSDGTSGAWIFADENGGRAIVYGKIGALKPNMNLLYGDGGFVGVVGNNGTPQATMEVWEGPSSGGRIHVYGSDKVPGLAFGFPKATVGGGEDGGTIHMSNTRGGLINLWSRSDTAGVRVHGKSYWQGLYKAAEIAVNEDGGIVVVRGKKKKSGIGMGVDENGGVFVIVDKDEEPAVFAGVGAKGGSVSVAGKDGELKTLNSTGLQ